MQSNNEGVNRVIESETENFAFLMESNSIQYQIGTLYNILFP